MWPWGHAAVGYVLLSGSDRLSGRRPTAVTTLTVLVATQLPDLIDKPLAWYVVVLPNGRSLAHSLVTGSVIVAVLAGALTLLGATSLRWPLLLGYLGGTLTDALRPLLNGDIAALAFLAWPILPPVQYDGPKGLVGRLVAIDPLTPWFLFQVTLVIAAVLVWIADGRPGYARVRAWLWRHLSRAA